MDRREFVLRGLGVVAGAGMAGGVLSCGGDSGGTGPDDGGGGGDGGGGNGGGGEFDGIIHLTGDLRFVPANVEIAVGTTVTWENESNLFHTITPDGHEEWERQTMSSTGETFEHTFNTAGTFDYFCEPHQSDGMLGTITVVSM